MNTWKLTKLKFSADLVKQQIWWNAKVSFNRRLVSIQHLLGRNRLIRRMRNYVPDIRFTGRERTDFSTVTPLTIANSFPEVTVRNFRNSLKLIRVTISSCQKDFLFIKAKFSTYLTRFRLSPMCCSTWRRNRSKFWCHYVSFFKNYCASAYYDLP